MAYADYYLCDVCGEKTFYDANLNYNSDFGEESYNENPITKHRWPDGYVGSMAVICKVCAKTHKIEILKVEPKP